MSIYPISHVKKGLLGLVKKIQDLHEVVTITRDGYPAAVLMSTDDYEGLLETIEILGDPHIRKTLKHSVEEARKGQFVDHKKVWEK